MSITTKKTAELVKTHGKDKTDTGNSEVQIAILTERIKALTEHFKTHAKDNHSRRGLIKLVSTRRRLLSYLKVNHLERYQGVVKALGLRK